MHETPYNIEEIEDILQEKLSIIMKTSPTSLAVLAVATQFKLYQVRSFPSLQIFSECSLFYIHFGSVEFVIKTHSMETSKVRVPKFKNIGDAVQRAKHVYTEARRVHSFRAATLQSDRYRLFHINDEC